MCITLQNFCYLCIGLGEKSRAADALAFISHFTKVAWKTSFGIVRLRSKGKSETAFHPQCSYAHAFGVEHSYMWVGVPFFQARPSGKVHKSGHAFLCALLCAYFMSNNIIFIMGKTKRFRTLLLGNRFLGLILWFLFSPLYAQTLTVDLGDGISLYFKIISEEDKTVEVSNVTHPRYPPYNQDKPTITIPSDVNGYRVVRIGERAFRNHNVFRIISMPESIVTIGDFAFYECSALETIELPESVEEVGSLAFFGCSVTAVYNSHLFASLNRYYQGSYEIPDGITKIAGYAFSDCHKLTSLSMPESVNEIIGGGSNFFDCNQLEKVCNSHLFAFLNRSYAEPFEIPEGITCIADFAFSGCSELPSVSIPSTVVSIGNSAFMGCENLSVLSLPSKISSIGNHSFWGCNKLERVDISESSILFNANWGGANGLLDNSRLYIDGVELEELEIPSNITKLPSNVFCGCLSIKKVTIPSSIVEVGYQAFSGCKNLETINIEEGCTSIGWGAFYESNIATITLPSSIKSIGDEAFLNCINLRSVTLPESLSHIGSSLFAGCSSLESIEFPDDLLSISSFAFRDCISLKSLYIPSKVYYISDNSFQGCSGLLSIKVDPNNATYDSRENCNAIIYKGGKTSLMLGCRNTVIPNGVEAISGNAFYNCQNLGTMIVPPSVSDIGVGAFFGCLADFYFLGIPMKSCFENGYKGVLAGSTIYVWSPFFEQTINYAKQYNLQMEIKTINKEISYPTSIGNIGSSQSFINILNEGWTLQQYDSEGEKFLVGLEPDTEYNTFFWMDTEKYGRIWGNCAVRTSSLQFSTLTPKVTNKGDAIVCATTNIADEETNVGFEWRKTDAPDVVASKTGSAAIYDGTMEGIIKNLDATTYWKVRPYYESSAGNKYYGDWIGFDPSDFSYFEPTVHTYANAAVTENSAVLMGYVVEGTDAILEQGMEYWISPASDSQYQTLEVHKATGFGQRMTIQLTNLEAGTTYAYRTYAVTSKGTSYGEEMTFRTSISSLTGVEDVSMAQEGNVSIIGYYNLQGKKLNELERGLMIVRYSNGTTKKVVIK